MESAPREIKLDDIITGVQTLRLEPGDTLVLLSPVHLTPSAIDRLFEQMTKAFPNHRVLVLENGMTIARIAAVPSVSGTASDAGA